MNFSLFLPSSSSPPKLKLKIQEMLAGHAPRQTATHMSPVACTCLFVCLFMCALVRTCGKHMFVCAHHVNLHVYDAYSLSVTCCTAGDPFEGADTPPTHMPTPNDLLVAMHMVYLVLLIVELFCYADEQSTL